MQTKLEKDVFEYLILSDEKKINQSERVEDTKINITLSKLNINVPNKD